MDVEPLIGVHLEGVLRNSRDPIYAVNSARRIVFVNRACEELVGVAGHELLGRECRFHGLTGDDRLVNLAGSLCPPPEAFAGQSTLTQALIPLADGQRAWRSIQFWPCHGENGMLAVVLAWIGSADPKPQADSARSWHTRLAELRHRLLERYGFDHIIAESPGMGRVLAQVRLAGQTSAPVLLVGEPGTGKEQLARTIHYQSALRERSFAAIDCSALPASVLDDELRLLSDPAVGAVYFREPARMPRDLQDRLVKHAEHPGTGARLLAGSSVDLREACGEGIVLEPLYYRLSTLTIAVPPLRERREDTFFLVQQVLEKCNAESGKQVTGVHLSAWEILQSHDWPGNLPELIAALTEAHARSKGPEIMAGDFPLRLHTARRLGGIPRPASDRPLPLDSLLEETERRLLQLALDQAKGNKSKAAARLAISRARLYRRMQQLGIADVEEDAAPPQEAAES